MKKRKVNRSDDNASFLGYEINKNGYLNCKSMFGCQSDWPDMVRYARNLNVHVVLKEHKVVLYQIVVARDLDRARTVSTQGPFLDLKGLHVKASHSIMYNWNVSNDLVKFARKARLSLHRTNLVYLKSRTQSSMPILSWSH